MNKVNAIVLGWYGYDNVGDELLLDVVLDFFGKKCTEITYISPKEDFRSQPGTKFNRIKLNTKYDLLKLLLSVVTTQYVVLGGGTYLRDIGGKNNLRIKLIILFVAIVFRKKTVFFGSGLGPFSYNKDSKLLRFVLRRISYPLLRDRKAVDLYKQISGKDAQVVPDPVVLRAISSKKCVESGDGVAFALREWHGPFAEKSEKSSYIKFISEMVSVVESYIQINPDKKVYFWVFQSCVTDAMADDSVVYDAIIKSIKFKFNYEIVYLHDSIMSLEQVYGQVSTVIGMRLHSLILGAVYGKKLISISYDQKVLSFMEELGISAFNIEYDDFTASLLAEKCLDLQKQSYTTFFKQMKSKAGLYNEVI